MKKSYLLLAGIVGFILVLVFFNTSAKNGQGSTVPNNTRAAAQKKAREIKSNTKKYQPKKTPKTAELGLDLSAKSAILVDQETNEIIYQKDSNQQLPPASITKVLTLALALEQFKPQDLITISQTASEQISNKINMKPGEKIKTDDLLYGLMMISANDAAWALADAFPGGFSKFMKKMNEKVELLGLKNTHFKNPAGLDDEGHFSSAFDIATMTRYNLIKHPQFLQYAGKTKEHSVYMTEHNEPHWWFGHLSAMLKRYPGMIAAKTGYTDEALSTYVGVAERNGRRLVVVILGSKDANNDVTGLLDYGFSH